MATTKPNLTRIWAGSADPSDILDPDVGSPGKFAAGWEAELPPYEYFNFLQKLFTEALAHVNEQGVSLWDTNTTYPVNAIVKGSDGQLYIAKTEQAGNNPTSDGGVNWLRRPFNKTVGTLVSLFGENIASLSSGDSYRVKSYFNGYTARIGEPLGGGIFVWDSTRAKSNHNGVTVFSPTVPWGGNTGSSHTDFLNAVGETDGAGSGCWIRDYSGNLSIVHGGATLNGVTEDHNAMQAVINVAAPSFNVGYGAEVDVPRATNNGMNSSILGGTVEVPPGVTLVGEGIGNVANKSGSHFALNFDGIGIRFVHRTTGGATLFHNGGMRNIAVSGTGALSTSAQRLVELGDSALVDTDNGAWNGSITGCLFNNTRGYGILSSHSQEWLIQHNFFNECNRSLWFNTVPASSRVLDNTFINTAATPCDVAINYQPGSLGGATGFRCEGNYIIGFIIGLYIAGCQGVDVSANVFEGTLDSAIKLSNTTYDGTNLGTQDTALPTAHMEANQFIAVGAAGNATAVVVLDNARFCTFEGNFNTSPFATIFAVIHLSESAAGLNSSNRIELPTHRGNNSGTVPIYDQNNSLWDAQEISDPRFNKKRNLTSLPVLGATGSGAIANLNGDTYALKPNQGWYRQGTEGELTLSAGTTSASAIGVSSIINQNTGATTLSTLTGGLSGQTVSIHNVVANSDVSIDGNTLTIPIFQSATYQYSGFYSGWRLVGKSF